METGEVPQTEPRRDPTRVEHTISGYADESITPKVVVCAAALFPVAAVVAAEEVLASMKMDFGLPPTTPLHCSVIFHSSERRRTPWGNINPKALNSSIESLCRNLASIGLRPIVVMAPNPSIFISKPPDTKSEETPLDAKGQAAVGFQAMSFHLTKLHGFGAVKLWIDPDPTKIPWLNGKRQANFTRSSFMDLGSNIEPPRSEPLIEGNPKPILLEIADLYAYVSARAHSEKGGWKNRWFQDMYSIINPEQFLWQTNPDPKWQNA